MKTTRLLAVLPVALLAGLAGCGPAAPSGDTAPAVPAAFPKAMASYVGKYTMNAGGAPRAMTIYADGTKIRMEGPPPAEVKASGVTIATVMDQASKKLVSFRVGAGAPKAAMVMDIGKMGEAGGLFEPDKNQASAKAVGADKVAGLSCTIWEIPAAAAEEPASQMCLTDDGITLRMNKAGAADKPSMLAEEVKRGPQDPSLFAPPADYEIVDYSPCAGMAAEAMAAAKAGKRPDMAKLQECAALGQKMNAIFGG